MSRLWSFVSAVGLGLAFGLGGAVGGGVAGLASGCGGCMWVSSSEIVATPESSCLEIAIDRADQDSGCGHVTLTGRNRCNEPFVVVPYPEYESPAVTVAPGAAFDVTISNDDYAVYNSEADAWRFNVPCTVGGKPLMLSFSAWL